MQRSLFMVCLPLVLVLALAPSKSLSDEVRHSSTVDGIYKPTSLIAYVRLGGRRINLPLGAVREAVLTKGLIPVRNRRIPIRKGKWEEVLERMHFLGIDGNASVSSSPNLVFRGRNNRTRKNFHGRTRKPLRVRMKGRYRFVPVTVTLQTNLNSRINGDKLLIDSPLSINVSGVVTARGKIRMSAKRLNIDPTSLR